MTNNYFTIERAGKYVEKVCVKDENGSIAFEDIMSMSYNEMKSYKEIDYFITAIMGAANTYFEESDEQTIVTLVGEDGVFIWGILIGPGDNSEELKYAFIDWKKDGKSYRYENI